MVRLPALLRELPFLNQLPSVPLCLLLPAAAAWAVALCANLGRKGHHPGRAAPVIGALFLVGAFSGWRGASHGTTPSAGDSDPSAPQIPSTTAFFILRIEEAGIGISGTGFSGRLWADSSEGSWQVYGHPASVRGSWGNAARGLWLVRGTCRNPVPGEATASVVLGIRTAYRLSAGESGLPAAARIAACRRALAGVWVDRLGDDAGTLAARIFLGPSLPLSRNWSEPFRRTGTLHLLAISGLHLGLLGGLAWLGVRIVTGGARWSRWAALVVLTVFTLLIGAPPSSRRALGMAWILALGPGWGRRTRLWNAWGWMAGILPLLDPSLPAGASYPLSLSATAGVLLGTRFFGTLRRRLSGACIAGGYWNGGSAVLDLLGACVGALLLTAPWSWLHFGVIYPLGLAANLLAVPCMAWVLICLLPAVIGITLGAGAQSLFVAPGRAAADGLLGLLRLASGWTGRWPLGWEIEPSGALALCVVLGATLWLGARILEHPPQVWKRRAGRRKTLCLVLASALPVQALLLSVDGRPAARAPLEVRFLEVGEGDAICVRLPGARWMVDLGVGGWYGEERLLRTLIEGGVRRLDRVWITHGDLDHWGGLEGLLKSPVQVDTLVIPVDAPFPDPFWQVLARARQRPVLIRQAAPWERRLRDGVNVRLLHPEAGLWIDDQNNRSFVMQVTQLPEEGRLGFGFLLAGDLERPWERLLLEKGAVRRAEVMQAGHHGSRTSGDRWWWETAAPILAVASSGTRNRFGFPHRETIEAAARHGARLIRTDQSGSVRIGVYRDRAEVRRDFPG